MVVVLFLFLGDVRSSLIVIATLLLTPVATFIVMNHYGLSANLMSLGGLAIAIGPDRGRLGGGGGERLRAAGAKPAREPHAEPCTTR